VNAGGGINTISDQGSNDSIVMPAFGEGFDTITGNLLSGGNLLDFRHALSGSTWNGDTRTLWTYISVVQSGNDATIMMSPTAFGTQSAIAKLTGVGSQNLASIAPYCVW
jgi:hypothetical protein